MTSRFSLHDDGSAGGEHDDEHDYNHPHRHPHGGVTGGRAARAASMRALRWVALLTVGFACVEAVGGWMTGSLARCPTPAIC
ncbi:hypothetical protein JOS77_18905 [Chromobacterium haemolyticum]|nr:hypothetical protein JOS77_18905 [Chromobacterium haemolyticum]